MSDDLATISTHTTMVQAELVKGVLETAGIEAYIHAPHANALYPGVLGEIIVQVRAEDLERAEEALEEGVLLEEDEGG